MKIKIHREEQWDLDCKPYFVLAVESPGHYKRICCLWKNGFQIFRLVIKFKTLLVR